MYRSDVFHLGIRDMYKLYIAIKLSLLARVICSFSPSTSVIKTLF